MYQHNINVALCKNTNRIRLDLLYFGHSVIDSEWTGRIVLPSFSRLYCVTRGTAYITMNGVRTELLHGKWYLLPAGSTFDYECVDEMEQLSFHLKLCDFAESDLLSGCKELICLDFPPVDYEYFKNCAKSNNILDGMKLRNIVYEMLIDVIEKNNINIYRENYSPCLYAALNYIKQHLGMNLTITEIAENTFVSKSTITKHFRNELGISVNEYITSRIMSEAEVMLITTNKSILDISEKFGFSDQFYFSRRFKEIFGVSPRSYRNMTI